MGGTQERGRGAVEGRVLYSPRQGDRVSHISLKIKCVALVRVPLMNPNAPYATSVLHRSPELERYSEKEVLLLQLEQVLYRAPVGSKEAPLDVRQQVFHPAHAVGNLPQAELLDGGATAGFGFKVDLPRDGSEGALPPSFVLPADEDAQPPSAADVKKYSESGLLGRGAGLLQSLKEGVAPAPDRDQWANVKWYGKVTIGRPGRLQGNDRIIIPFQYLSPPERKASALLDKRVELTQQLRANKPFGQLAEPSSTWQSIPLGMAQSELQHKKKGLSALFSRGGNKVESDWSLELPSDPLLFPLQASVPFTIVSKTQQQVGAPLAVGIYRRVHLYRRKDSEAVDERLIVAARVAPKPAVLISQARGTATYRWQGVVDLPSTAGPSFATDTLGVSYYLGIKELHQPTSAKNRGAAHGPLTSEFVLVMPLEVFCPAPKMITPMRPSVPPPPPGVGGSASAQGMPPPPPRRVQPSTLVSAADEKRALAARAETEKTLPSPPPLGTDAGPSAPHAHVGAAPTAASAPAPAAAQDLSATAPDAYAGQPQAEEMHTGLDLPPSYFEATRIRDED